MAAKPADYFVTAFDFFAFLVPGALVVLGLPVCLLQEVFPVVEWASESWGFKQWGLILVGSFVAGHLVYGLAAFIWNPLYKSLYWRKARRHTIEDIEELRVLAAAKLQMEVPDDVDGRYWEVILRRAKACLIVGQPAAYEALLQLESVSKLFRSISVVALILVIVQLCCLESADKAIEGNAGPSETGFAYGLVVWLVVAVLAAWRFANRRKEHERRTLELFLVSGG